MKALVVTSCGPIMKDIEISGLVRRFSMFMRAIASTFGRITIVNFVAPWMLERYPSIADVERTQKETWGVPVSIELVPTPAPPKNFWSHYGAGILSINGHPDYCGASAREAVAAVRRHLSAEPDFVFAHRLAAMCSILQTGITPSNLMFDLDDVEHRVQERRAFARPWWPGKLLYLAQSPAIRLGERRAVAAARVVTVCSDLDRAYLGRLGWSNNVAVIPNAVTIQGWPSEIVATPTMLFLGNLGYAPNADAAERLVRNIWPRVRRTCPDANLLIAGKWHEKLPSAAIPPPGVTYLGFVPDLDALYSKVRVVCCPVGVGGGTRIKLIEAGAYAKPIVSTSIGAEGLGFVDGVHALIRDDDQSFADACSRLLQSDETCMTLSCAIYKKTKSKFDVSEIESEIAQLIYP